MYNSRLSSTWKRTAIWISCTNTRVPPGQWSISSNAMTRATQPSWKCKFSLGKGVRLGHVAMWKRTINGLKSVGIWNLKFFLNSLFLGSGITWQGACVSIKMADSGPGFIEQGTRHALQCQIPQSSHRIMHNPFVLFGLSRSPNFVEEVHLGAPRPPSMGKWQHEMIRQIVPNSRVIVIPPGLDDRNGSWQSRLYVTPSRLIILSM